jgi:hypothetical protein
MPTAILQKEHFPFASNFMYLYFAHAHARTHTHTHTHTEKRLPSVPRYAPSQGAGL